jgi:hypothetical protein
MSNCTNLSRPFGRAALFRDVESWVRDPHTLPPAYAKWDSRA